MNIYDESESDSIMESNRESYGDVFGKKKKPGIGNPTNKMSSTGGAAGKYNLSNIKSDMFGNFGNTGADFGNSGANFGNFGKTAQVSNMLGPFSNTGGIGKDIYGININIDTDKYKNEKKDSIKNEEKNKKGNKKKKGDFLDQIEDELGDSSINKNSSKVDNTEQSQKNSRIKNQISLEKNEEEEKEEEKDEIKEDNNEDGSIPEVNDEDKGKTASEKVANMEEYMKMHKPKIDWSEINKNQNNNIKSSENENQNQISVEKKSIIEEQINSNNDISNSKLEKESKKIENISKNNNDEEDDDYGGFDDNINSIAINNQDNPLSSFIGKTNNFQNKVNDTAKQIITESNKSKSKILASSGDNTNYEGEFGQSNLAEVNKLESEKKSISGADSLINQINKEHKKNLESLNSKITYNNQDNINVYSNSDNFNNNLNNNLNNKLNNINSVSSSNSVNAENLIKNEVKKYANEIPGYSSNDNNNNNLGPNKYTIGSSINLNNNDNNQYINKYSNNNYDIQNVNKYNNNQIQGFTFNNNKNNTFDLNHLREENIESFFIFKSSKPQINLQLMKKEEALKQEKRKRESIEFELQQRNDELAKLYNKIKKLEFTISGLKADAEENKKIIANKNKNYEELKNDFDELLKTQKQQIINIEKSKNENSMKDMEAKFLRDLLKKQDEIENLKYEKGLLENKYNNLDKEYKQLRDSQENNDEIYELKKENYRLNEQINKLKGEKMGDIGLDALNKNNENKSDAKKVYEQILNEREINAQEKLLNNYLKEIKKLNEEIYFLKTLPPGVKRGASQAQKNLANNVDMTLNNINYKKPINVINPSIQESAEKQIKKLQNFLLPSSPNDINNNKMLLMEQEFSRLQNKDSPNEITFDIYLTVMKSLNVPLSSSELIEIFNNFPRVKGNRIRMNDFINALNSKVPSSFFMQSDPSYLNELESKLIKGQNRIKELEKFILINNNENEELKEQMKKVMNENKLLKNKINDLNSQILQYFLFREEKNLANPDVIQMKEKMKNFELKNKTMNNELSEKFGKYEKKIEELKKSYEDERVNLLKEKDGFKDQINKLKNEKEKVKNEFDKKEIKYKTEIDQLNEKLLKYKKNYNILVNKNENYKKEKDKLLNCFKERGFDTDQVMLYINNSDNIQEILSKIEELERKNLNREEIYKRICMNANATQLKKEIEKIEKKHEEEKKKLYKIITQKNNELNSIRTEFSEIMNELEKLKMTKFK